MKTGGFIASYPAFGFPGFDHPATPLDQREQDRVLESAFALGLEKIAGPKKPN